MNTPAVLLIIFNRPNTTQEVFEAIRRYQPVRLYIAADAPRYGNPTDEEKCFATKTVVENVDWPCEVRRLYQLQNLGCNLAPRAAFSWFFSQEKEGIILEDDCIPHPDFFVFAAAMLDRYRNDLRIISINGSNLGYQLKNGDSYTYSRFMNMWGWATWADRAQSIDYSLSEWRRVQHPLWFLFKHMRQSLWDIDINWYKYWQNKFDLTVSEKTITWWDWQWIYHQLRRRQLSIVPAVNLVTNIGFDVDGTHTREENNPAANIPTYSMYWPLVHTSKIKPDYLYEELFVKWVWCYHKRLPTMFYIKQFISRLIGRS